jgi:hypothetical protein
MNPTTLSIRAQYAAAAEEEIKVRLLALNSAAKTLCWSCKHGLPAKKLMGGGEPQFMHCDAPASSHFNIPCMASEILELLMRTNDQ